MGIDPLADDGGQQTLSPYLAMGANPACNVDPLGLKFNPVQDMPRGGGLSSPEVAFVDGGWVVMGAWAMAFGKNSSMQAIIDELSNADGQQQMNNAWANLLAAEATGWKSFAVAGYGSGGGGGTGAGPDGADAAEGGGGGELASAGSGEKWGKGKDIAENPDDGKKKADTKQDYYPAPKGLPGFPNASKRKYKPESDRYRWKMPNGDILEWDKQHGEVERYDKSGKNHLGAYYPNIGEEKEGKRDPNKTTPKYSSPLVKPYDGPQYTPFYYPGTGAPINPNISKTIIYGGTAIIVIDVVSTYWPLLLL